MDSKKLFREKSIERVSSPEELNRYVRVVNPGIWVFLIAIVCLIVGVVFWGFFGKLSTTVACVVNPTGMVAYIPEADAKEVETGMEIATEAGTYRVLSVQATPVKLSVADNAYLLHLLGTEEDSWVNVVKIESIRAEYADGDFAGKIELEKLTPISLMMN